CRGAGRARPGDEGWYGHSNRSAELLACPRRAAAPAPIPYARPGDSPPRSAPTGDNPSTRQEPTALLRADRSLPAPGRSHSAVPCSLPGPGDLAADDALPQGGQCRGHVPHPNARQEGFCYPAASPGSDAALANPGNSRPDGGPGGALRGWRPGAAR